MPKISLSVPHKMGQDAAKQKISKLIADSRDKFGPKVSGLEEAWNGYVDNFSFSAMGFAVDGRLDVQPSAVQIDLNLPWAALPFKSTIESEIVKHAKDLLA